MVSQTDDIGQRASSQMHSRTFAKKFIKIKIFYHLNWSVKCSHFSLVKEIYSLNIYTKDPWTYTMVWGVTMEVRGDLGAGGEGENLGQL